MNDDEPDELQEVIEMKALFDRIKFVSPGYDGESLYRFQHANHNIEIMKLLNNVISQYEQINELLKKD